MDFDAADAMKSLDQCARTHALRTPCETCTPAALVEAAAALRRVERLRMRASRCGRRKRCDGHVREAIVVCEVPLSAAKDTVGPLGRVARRKAEEHALV